MPRISTDNYDTVASWNGSQDLFVVEQPDGTKVATPAQVKQFIEAGDFEATGEIKDGHGNILKDMAKSADVDAEIGDLSQTGLTGDSVAAQLGDAKEKIDVKIGNITLNSGWNFDNSLGASVVKKQGDIAWLSAHIYNDNNLTANQTYEIGSLPTGFIPQKVASLPIYGGDNNLRGVLVIDQHGKLQYTSKDGNRWALYRTVVYPLS